MTALQLSSLRALRLACGAAWLALACGSNDHSRDNGPATSGSPSSSEEVPSETARLQETCVDNVLLAGCLPSTSPPPPDGGFGDPAELAKAAAQNVLDSNCGQCHGPTRPGAERGGMDYIADIDHLVEFGKLIPLNSAGSPILRRMQNGDMPPPASGLPPVTQADIDTVAQFIDNPRFWPNFVAADCSSENPPTTFDSLFRAINQDLIAAGDNDAPFYRYLSISNRFTAGVCTDAALDQDRQALVKMMNLLSNGDKPGKAVPIDPNQTLYRIDLRDFNWNHPLVLNGQSFTDVWEATAANNPYNVQWVGADANSAIARSKTNFPFQMSDMMMRNNIIGAAYYAIISIDMNQNIDDFIANVLQVNVTDDVDRRVQARAATTRSRVSRVTRLVQRDALGLQPGALWQIFDDANDADRSLFQDPLGFVPGGSQAIFTRPNGMLGFLVANGDGVLQEESDIRLDTSERPFRAVTSISCSNCHASGVIPVADELKAIVLPNALNIGLNQDQREGVTDIYLDSEAFAQQVSDDNTLYQSALEGMGLPAQGADPVSAIWLQFDADVNLDTAAGDLGLRPRDLGESLDLVDPILSVFRNNGSLARDDFTALYVDSLCRLSTVFDNVPLPATCEQAAADVRALDGGN